jgi:hypothetical protein
MSGDKAPSGMTTEIAVVPEGAVAVQEGPGALLAAIVQLAKDPAVDEHKLEALLKMQERMEDRQAEREFIRALSVAQGEIPQVGKMGTVALGSGKGSYKFARWEDMDRVIRPIMDRHGFMLSFNMEMKDGGGAVVTGTLLHRDGHSKTASVPLALDAGAGRNNLQAMGSTLSYGKRYCAEMLLNIVRKDEDDDGVRAGQKFITPYECEILIGLLKETGREESTFLQHLFAGAIHSVEEIEAGSGFLAAKSTLEGILRQKKAKEAAPNG